MAAPHDVPTMAQLVEAVREWLERDVMAAGGGLGFNARVAANVLGIVERELAAGSTHAEAHRRRLALLGAVDDADLSRMIRNGQLDDRLPEVRDLVRQSVADKVAISNPRYL